MARAKKRIKANKITELGHRFAIILEKEILQKLDEEADREDRSRTAQLRVILKERYMKPNESEGQ